jgi:long-chain acyl-CoA synthetase
MVDEWATLSFMARNSLPDYLSEFNSREGDIGFVERRGLRSVSCTFGELAHQANAWARLHAARGLEKGDRILLWGDNSAAWVAAFWGCLLRGAIAVPMDRGASPEFARRIAEESGTRLAIVDPDLASVFKGMAAIQTISLETELRGNSNDVGPPILPARLERADPAEIIFTSGATAEPKGVVLTHGNLLASIESLEGQIRPYLRYERPFHPLRFVVVLPLSHAFGQLLGIWVPLLLGATVIFPGTLRPGELLQTIRRERASVVIAVPHILDSMRENLESNLTSEGQHEKFRQRFNAMEGAHFFRRWWEFRAIHSRLGWKFWAFISGGAALSVETEIFWDRLGFVVIQGYGLTETASLISVNHPFRTNRRSLGKALPGVGVRLGPGGEILVRGDNVSAGYWNGGRNQSVVGEDGWFHTGDLGEADAAGNLYFRGRSKNVIVTAAGLNIHPEDLEAALRSQPGIRDCAVVGIESEGNAEACAALLLRRQQTDASAAVRTANSTLADSQQIRKWFIWPESDFPRTPTQKPILREIQRAAQDKFGRGAATGESDGKSSGWLSRFLRDKTAGDQGGDLSSLTSLERVELLSLLEDRYNIEIDEATFNQATTAAEVESLLRAPAPQQAPFHYPRWARQWVTRFVREAAYYLLVGPAVLLFASPRVRGRENLSGVIGPVLVISNHVADFDSALILASLPASLRRRLTIAMGGERLRDFRRPSANLNWLLRVYRRIQYVLLVSAFHVFPLPKRVGFRESSSYVGELTDAGWSTLIFPEGEVTQDGKIHPFRSGIGLLASRLAVPVIPARISGIFEMRQEHKWFARPGTVRVTFGPPMVFPPGVTEEEITRALEERVRSL